MKPDTHSIVSVALARMAEDGRLDREDLMSLNALHWRSSSIAVGRSPDLAGALIVVRSGWACRVRIVPSGQRQLMALLVPGDVCSFDILAGDLRAASYWTGSVTALSPLSVLHVPVEEFASAVETRPGVMRALLASLQLERAIAEEHMISLGSRSARGRMAHFLCELNCRLARVGLVHGGRFALPMTQTEMGEYLALSSVHVNRTLQHLRNKGFLSMSRGLVRILDGEGLARLADFNENYLSLKPGEADQPSQMCAGTEEVAPRYWKGLGLREAL